MKLKKRQFYKHLYLLAVFAVVFTLPSYALPVIPNGKGFGLETPAGRRGKIIKVTNLEPSGNGSFRAAVDASGPRIVIFEVSGTIIYHGRYKIRNPFITIAGQTAPSPGITLRGSTLTIDTHDVLIQHIRVRTGDDLKGVKPDYRDALNIGLTNPPEKLYNIVVDHCSVSWGVDETMTIGGCSNITYSNCIISEPLSYSLHSKGEHSKAIMIGDADSVSILNNIIAHSRDRNPVIRSGVRAVVANNLIYNPGDFNIRISCFAEPSQVSVVGNITIKGKDTSYTAARQTPTIWKNPAPGTKIYLADNRCHKKAQSSPEDWSLVRNKTTYSNRSLKKKVGVFRPPIWIQGFTAMPSSQVKSNLLRLAGARPLDRDDVDKRIITNIKTGKGRIINTPSAVGGWPGLREMRRKLVLPTNPNDDSDGDGYTNMEEWLHEMAKKVESEPLS